MRFLCDVSATGGVVSRQRLITHSPVVRSNEPVDLPRRSDDIPAMSDQVPEARAVQPYIPASQSLPELTIGVLILGCVLSVVLAGMTVSASVPAAVISMALFRVVRRGNILQNNAVQTAAASGEGLAAGVIFTLPALVLLGTWKHFDYLETTLIAGFGGVLGVLFTIPLRRALIIDQPLQFPEGVATAEVLKVG